MGKLVVRLVVRLVMRLEMAIMARIPVLIPVTDLRKDAAAILKRVESSSQPLVITQRGRSAAVMLSVDAYEHGEQERDLLRLLVRGEQEIDANVGHDSRRGTRGSQGSRRGRSFLRVRFTPAARAQFLAAIAYVRRENPQAAAALRQRAGDTLRRLEQFPESGRLIPEFPDLPYREIVVRPYRFFYRIKGSTVWVVAAWHGAQLPKKP